MVRRLFITVFMIVISSQLFSQAISDTKRKIIVDELQKQITIISSFSSEKLDMIPVYTIQLKEAENILSKNEEYKSDNQIYAKLYELKTLVTQNKELVDFMTPRVGDWFYRKAVDATSKKQKNQAYEYINKALIYDPNNVMANYELAKIKLDSGKITQSTNLILRVISKMNPKEEEKILCKNLLAYAYDKNMLKALGLMKEGKYAYAVDILTELDSYCAKDKLGICNKIAVKTNLDKCKNGIYNDHLLVTNKAIEIGRHDVAGNFVHNTYEYVSKNRDAISDTSSFDMIVQTVVNAYIVQAQGLNTAMDNDVKQDIINRTKQLAAMVGGSFEADALKQISAIRGTRTPVDMKLDSIESSSPNTGYSINYANYVKDTVSDPRSIVRNIEKDYIPSSDNKNPNKGMAVQSTKTQTLTKEIDDKFYETRSFMTVNNYEKVLEILESANRLAKVDKDKKEVEKMYIAAIREITARRMSAAEYCIFKGEEKKADSLIAKTDDLLTTYKMKEDTVIVKIMGGYLRALDRKMCENKQDEINGFIYNTLDCIRKNDFYQADKLLDQAMQVKGSTECQLDKSRVRQLKRQIEKPIEYLKSREAAFKILKTKDSVKFILNYALLENFYHENKLNEVGLEHKNLRSVLTDFRSDLLILSSVEQLMKYRNYECALETLGALKDMGAVSKETKRIQEKIGRMMSIQVRKHKDNYNERDRILQKYGKEKWFEYFSKEFEKYSKRWAKNRSTNVW